MKVFFTGLIGWMFLQKVTESFSILNIGYAASISLRESDMTSTPGFAI